MTILIAWSMLVSALIAIAAAAVERVAAHFSAPRRFVWIGAMIAATVAPVVIATRPLPVASDVASVASVATSSSIPNASSKPAVSPETRNLVSMDFGSPASSLVDRIDEWFPRVWLITSLTCFALLLRAVLRLRRDRRQWTDADSEIGRVFVARDSGPAVVGVFRPRVVIPGWALRADAATRELLLRHELEHIRAGDSRVLFGIAVLLSAFPWNAALWWIARRVRLAIEIDCDARVIRAVGGARAHAYGLMLLSVGERFASANALPMSASLSEPGSHLGARIHAMTTPRQRRPIRASLPFAGIAAVVLLTAASTPRPAPLMRHSTREPKPLRGNPAPRYPDSLRGRGVEGNVIARFAVDRRGIPDSSTIEIVEATREQFAASVRRALPSWRFDSAGVVRIGFEFFLSGPGEASRVRGVTGVDPNRTVSITAVPLPPSDVQQSPVIPNTPAGRVFKSWLDATNSGQA
ncbi:MAG TPA: M56 family metallopeptidase, partial [Gemmatimonadaceae bacterium]